MKTIYISLLLLTSTVANAKTYSRTWTDIIDPKSGFVLERTYNSQSLINGAFGFGWCSQLETRIETTRDGRLKLRSCLEQKETTFVSSSSPQTSRVKGSPNRQPAFSPREGGSFQSLDAAGDRIERHNNGYNFYKNNALTARFDEAGRLLEWKSAEGVLNRIERNVGGDPVSWETSRGFRLSLRAEPGTGRIRSISLPGGRAVSYQYFNENLVLVKTDQESGEWAHQYDDLHNMVRSTSSDGFTETIIYDKYRDEMLQIRREIKRN